MARKAAKNQNRTTQAPAEVKGKLNIFEKAQQSFVEAQKTVTPHLPSEIIGGAVPYVAGTEDEAVWNAASQACGTEHIHYVYTVDEGRCWYLAIPSHALSNAPNTWCPLAAALPGNSEYWDKETVYLYEQEGLASALRWDPETNRMQVFIGASRTVLPRIQSMDANFVTINPEVADIVRWKNRSLESEKLARNFSRIVLFSGIFVAIITVAYILAINFMTITLKPDLKEAQTKTTQATRDLMQVAAQTLQNESIKHMVRIQELLDVLVANEGTLVMYKVSNNGQDVTWEALVPQAFSNGAIPELGRTTTLPGVEDDGRVRIRGTR